MLHPSYTELMKVINGDSEEEESYLKAVILSCLQVQREQDRSSQEICH